jgi:hypothetical protein
MSEANQKDVYDSEEMQEFDRRAARICRGEERAEA